MRDGWAQIIASERHILGFTHKEVAQRAGISETTSARAGSGCDVRVDSLMRILRVLGLRVVVMPEQFGVRRMGRLTSPAEPVTYLRSPMWLDGRYLRDGECQ